MNMVRLRLLLLCLLGISTSRAFEQLSLTADSSKQKENSLFCQACQTGSWEDCFKLLTSITTGVGEINSTGQGPLHMLVAQNDCHKLKKLIEMFLNIQDNQGRTPLFLAAAQGNEDAVRVLLEGSANPNICTKEGRSPLHEALSYKEENYQNIAKLLITYEADINTNFA